MYISNMSKLNNVYYIIELSTIRKWAAIVCSLLFINNLIYIQSKHKKTKCYIFVLYCHGYLTIELRLLEGFLYIRYSINKYDILRNAPSRVHYVIHTRGVVVGVSRNAY